MRPIKSDSRYTVNREFCGYESPRWVARFCGDWLGQSISYSAMVLRCASHKAIRNGAAIIEEST